MKSIKNENIQMNFDYLEKICYDLYIKSNGDFKIVKECIKSLKISESVFIISTKSYIDKNIVKPEYVLIFENLLKLKTDDEVIKYLSTVNYSLKYLQSNLLSYYFYFRPDIYFFRNDLKEKLNNMLNSYQVYLKLLDEPPLDIINKSSIEYAIFITKKFIKSQTTLERFCFQNNMTFQTFKNFIKKIKYEINPNGEKQLSKLYIEYEKNILIKEELKKIDIKSEVLKLFEIIKNSDNKFNILDYALNTKYGIKELVKIADLLYDEEHIFNFDELKLFRLTLNNFLGIKRYQSFEIQNLYNEDKKIIFTVNDELIELDSNIKKKIINFLLANEIPVSFDSIKLTYMHLAEQNTHINNEKEVKLIKK